MKSYSDLLYLPFSGSAAENLKITKGGLSCPPSLFLNSRHKDNKVAGPG
jgi:hypothetical protein